MTARERLRLVPISILLPALAQMFKDTDRKPCRECGVMAFRALCMVCSRERRKIWDQKYRKAA